MGPGYGAICEFCEHHPVSFHQSSSDPCPQCLPPTRELQQCATCKAVLYCSVFCRKQHQKDHKLTCNVNAKILHLSAVAGYSARVDALKEWLEERAAYPLSVCGVSALQLRGNRERAGQHVLVVRVTCEVAPRPSFESDEIRHFKYAIKSAQCCPMEKLGTLFYPRLTLSSHPALAILPKSTDYMRIIIVDEELPPPIDMHLIRCVIPDKVHEMPYDSDWLMHLQEIVALDSLANMREYYETTVAPRAAKSTNSSLWAGCIVVFAIIIWWKWVK